MFFFENGPIWHDIKQDVANHRSLIDLNEATIKKLITKGGYDFWAKYDLCAGRKKKFKTIQKFTKSKSGRYVYLKNTTNFLGMNKDGNYEFDYYVSGSDSCSGDSGGGWVVGTMMVLPG